MNTRTNGKTTSTDLVVATLWGRFWKEKNILPPKMGMT